MKYAKCCKYNESGSKICYNISTFSLTAPPIPGGITQTDEVTEMSTKKILPAVLAVAVVVIAIFVGVKLLGGGSYEDKLLGEWYADPEASSIDEPFFTLYSDGTCTIWGEYGTGHWALVNDNQLKLTNIYGQVLNIFDGSSTPMTIVSLTKDCLTLEDPDQTMQVDFYHQR